MNLELSLHIVILTYIIKAFGLLSEMELWQVEHIP